MHKQIVNDALLTLSFELDGPVLIKAGESGLDPTHPDMEWVRSNGQIFLPGSSLKGVVRSHSERIVRTLQSQGSGNGRGACDPLDRRDSCSQRLERERTLSSAQKYARSCFICRLFGNTVIASHALFRDALPAGAIRLEERNGVAIDRIFGSVAVGPFNYEVATSGRFDTTIYLKNFTISQLALVGLALRDIGAGRVGIGFGKSRGLGRVKIQWQRVEVRYPLAGLSRDVSKSELLGVGAFGVRGEYGFPGNDRVPLPDGMTFTDDDWGNFELAVDEPGGVDAFFQNAVSHWRQEVVGG